jgi:hypothetical protein
MDKRFAQLLNKNAASLRQLCKNHPESLVLPVAPTAELEARLLASLESGDVHQANRVFWLDQLATFDAWRSIVLWRASEVIDAALMLRDQASLLSSVTLTRSVFELAMASLVVSGRLCKVLNMLDISIMKSKFCGSTTFPDDVEMAIFGTRVPEAESNGLPSQRNVLSYMAQLEKIFPDAGLKKSYELLCDVTHPSWLGNRPFYRRNDQGTICRVSQEYDPLWHTEVSDLTATVLSWSAQAIEMVMDQSQSSIERVRSALRVDLT